MKVPDQIAIALKQHGIDVIFGIVGIPIVELAECFVQHGIRFIACRNEQSCSYAASAYGYLTKKPGVILVVGGPGIVHALAGIYNSYMNKWPLLVLAGSSEDEYHGGFQELDQLSFMAPWAEFKGRINPENAGYLIYSAIKTSTLQNGVSYIDIPGNLMDKEIECTSSTVIHEVISSKRCGPDMSAVKSAAELLVSGKRILVVVGRGCINYSQELREFVQQYRLPFLPTPMAKGILPDSHVLNVNGARSLALKTAEIVLVLGARLNWMLHYGEPPKWKKGVIFIQVDNDLSSLGLNNSAGLKYAVHSDTLLFVQALKKILPTNWKYRGVSDEIENNIALNKIKLEKKEILPEGAQLNYHAVYAKIRRNLVDKNTILILEGANTMDIGRICFPTDYPRHRLDAGTNASMGVGVGYALAAKIAEPKKDIVAILGDSAFGFSCAELETAVRNNLGIVVIIMNNGGIYHGNTDENLTRTTDLTSECRYDMVGKGFGCEGFLIRYLSELDYEFRRALNASKVGITTVLNVIIEAGSQAKLSFGWQSKSKV
ncbi:HDL126Cp [Eremothecium sinecaudum]|uniref:2-hydroxyacyl-CoA lyase n=1 Tax=Eremothecium sinecaudum TaxID=45286 RepID=A0A0X8HSJ7_9SACH|nr:HDL126Cp [Eremothecium sinecaudum]AMD20618.1 HDL126Cp [Eremothecium sinecaudum]